MSIMITGFLDSFLEFALEEAFQVGLLGTSLWRYFRRLKEGVREP